MSEWRPVKSSDPSVIRVEDGVTVATGFGEATITYVLDDDPEERIFFVTVI